MDDHSDTEKIVRAYSTTSMDSVASFRSEDLDAETDYEKAPWDIFGEHSGLGRIKLVKAGSLLPIETGYKTKKDGTAEIGVKFRYLDTKLSFCVYLVYILLCYRVSQKLEVAIVKIKHLNEAEQLKINASFDLQSNSSRLKKSGPVQVAEVPSTAARPETFVIEEEDHTVRTNTSGVRTTSKQDWLFNFQANFFSIVIENMEIGMRTKVSQSIEKKVALRGKENQAVINSVNHTIYEFVGSQRPEKALCR